MIVCAINVYHHLSGEFKSRTLRGVFDTTLCDKDCQLLAIGRWFSPGTSVSSINTTDSRNMTKILLKVGFNTINLTLATLEPDCLQYTGYRSRFSEGWCVQYTGYRSRFSEGWGILWIGSSVYSAQSLSIDPNG